MLNRDNLPAAGLGTVGGAGAVLIMYMISQNIFVTPAALQAEVEKIRAQQAEKFVTRSEYNAAIDKINSKLDIILDRIGEIYTFLPRKNSRISRQSGEVVHE